MPLNRYENKYGQIYYAQQPMENGGSDIAGTVTYRPQSVKSPATPVDPTSPIVSKPGNSLLAYSDRTSGGGRWDDQGNFIPGRTGEEAPNSTTSEQEENERKYIEDFKPKLPPTGSESDVVPSGSGAYVYKVNPDTGKPEWQYVPKTYGSLTDFWNANMAQTKAYVKDNVNTIGRDIRSLLGFGKQTTPSPVVGSVAPEPIYYKPYIPTPEPMTFPDISAYDRAQTFKYMYGLPDDLRSKLGSETMSAKEIADLNVSLRDFYTTQSDNDQYPYIPNPTIIAKPNDPWEPTPDGDTLKTGEQNFNVYPQPDPRSNEALRESNKALREFYDNQAYNDQNPEVPNPEPYNSADVNTNPDMLAPDFHQGLAEGGPVERLSNDVERPMNPGIADDLPRNLSEGEFVIPAKIVDRYGKSAFESLLADDNVYNMAKGKADVNPNTDMLFDPDKRSLLADDKVITEVDPRVDHDDTDHNLAKIGFFLTSVAPYELNKSDALKHSEGDNYKPYKVTINGKTEPRWTIGQGVLLDDGNIMLINKLAKAEIINPQTLRGSTRVPKSIVDQVALMKWDSAVRAADNTLGVVDGVTNKANYIYAAMVYQLGADGAGKFKEMIKLLKMGTADGYRKAADEIAVSGTNRSKSSLMMVQTPRRVEAIQSMLRQLANSIEPVANKTTGDGR